MLLGRGPQGSVDQLPTRHGCERWAFLQGDLENSVPMGCPCPVPSSHTLWRGGSSHSDADEMSPDQVTPLCPCQACWVSAERWRSPRGLAILQQPLRKTTTTGFFGKPVSRVGFAGQWWHSFGVLGCQLHTGGEHQPRPCWIN